MHRVLYFIVRADNEQDAVEEAQEWFDEELVGRADTTYDYCKPMESGHNVAGSDRWSDYAGEPLTARVSDETGREWLTEAMEWQRRHVAEALYAMYTHMRQCLEESVETAPAAIDQILDFAKENDELGWSEGGEKVLEEWPRTIDALQREEGAMHRYWAQCFSDNNPMEAHIMDCYTYNSLTIADNGFRLENVEEMLEDPDGDMWVVPLDCHH